MTKVRMMPAIGAITVSERLRIILKMLLFQVVGVMPTSPAISPTFVFRVSNIPVRFEMIPSMSSSLNHSWIISNIKGDHLLCGGSRYEAKAPAGFGETSGGGQQTGQQGDQGDADEGNAAARHKLFYPQLGVKLCSMAGGGVQKIYMVFLREPSRRDRSGSDLFHLRDGFEIEMNFDRNVSCFIFVNALMHDDFFD